jgi:hypothetical protein
MIALFFWLIWSFVASVGIKYTSMQLLNVNLSLVNSFLILLTYQWIRLIKPPNKEDINNINNAKNKHKNIDHKSISDFNSIINTNFKKRNKGNK